MAKRDIDEIRKELTDLKPSVNNVGKLKELVQNCLESIRPFAVNMAVLATIKEEKVPAVEDLESVYSEESFETIRHYLLNRLLEIKPA